MANPSPSNPIGAPSVDALREAYERGRVRFAAARSIWAIPLGLFALWVLDATPTTAVALTALLAITFAATQHAGTSVGRGGRVGLVLGIIPLLSPWVVQSTHLCCMGGSCSTNCLQMCALGGFLAGGGLALWARKDARPLHFVLGGGVVMLASSGLGCAALEWGGLLGVGAGLVASLPVLITSPRATA